MKQAIISTLISVLRFPAGWDPEMGTGFWPKLRALMKSGCTELLRFQQLRIERKDVTSFNTLHIQIVWDDFWKNTFGHLGSFQYLQHYELFRGRAAVGMSPPPPPAPLSLSTLPFAVRQYREQRDLNINSCLHPLFVYSAFENSPAEEAPAGRRRPVPGLIQQLQPGAVN